jgi:hypothetical protein
VGKTPPQPSINTPFVSVGKKIPHCLDQNLRIAAHSLLLSKRTISALHSLTQMAAYLTFTSTDILNSSLVTPNGAIRYTISTTSKNKWNGPKHRATTVATVSTNLTGIIGWESETLTIGGVERPWSTLGQRAFVTIGLGCVAMNVCSFAPLG